MTYIFFADEADQDKKEDGTFLIYGGAAILADDLPKLNSDIDSIRQEFNFLNSHSLKFSPNDKPDHLSNIEFIEVKKRVFECALQRNVKFFSYAFNNNCARKEDGHKIKISWGADQLLAKFNSFLHDNQDYGLVAFDQTPFKGHRNYLKDKFNTQRLEKTKYKSTDRILAYTTCYDGTSHLSSVADIMVGSFRMIVNQPERTNAGRELAQLLKHVFARDLKKEDCMKITDYSMSIRPIADNIRHRPFAQQNKDLQDRILTWMNDTEE